MYCPPQEFNSLLDEYYQMRGWDKNGIPNPEKLKELGLDEVLKDLHKK
jgi:aldehyde:ferredoxin oxidoreductase